jgi:hypothetical protein
LAGRHIRQGPTDATVVSATEWFGQLPGTLIYTFLAIALGKFSKQSKQHINFLPVDQERAAKGACTGCSQTIAVFFTMVELLDALS